MGSLGPFSGLLSKLILTLSFFWRSDGSPIPPRGFDSTASIDPGIDAWADTLSGISPLILLIGERVTKQLLRNVRSTSDAFSLAAAPLGLLSVATSVIRCCGIQRLRAFIGYELEARAVAAIEMTQANCGGVHAEVVEGYIVRSASANPASQAVAVSLLQGNLKKLSDETLLQIQLCNTFQNEKLSKGVPKSIAAVNWVLHILSAGKDDIFQVVETLVRAVDSKFTIDLGDDKIRTFCQSLMANSVNPAKSNDEKSLDQQRVTPCTETDEIYPIAHSSSEPPVIESGSESLDGPSFNEKRTRKQHNTDIMAREVTLDSPKDAFDVGTVTDWPGTWRSRSIDLDAQSPQLAFMYTLDAVSEFTTASPVPKHVALLLGLISSLIILALYITALWQEQWQISIGLTLAIIGYIGIVLAVMSATLIIHSSCACIKLENRSALNPELWKDGLVISVKNTDSMDTTGSDFMSSQFGSQHFEMVWMRELTGRRKGLASGTVVVLVLFFICHYLGLRSTSWWVAVGELFVCLLAALARSATKDRHGKFNVVEQVKIDKRCSSTGIIRTQKGQIINKSLRNTDLMDSRAYSKVSLDHTPASGESIAWCIAELCSQDEVLAAQVLELTGMRVQIEVDAEEGDFCSVLVSYSGGLLVTEGLASPNARLCLAFQSKTSDLALPTALLARAIMRQPEWFTDHEDVGKGISLGNVYIFSINSIVDWWTISEDRNDLGDLQSNLQWSFILINTAFFISLLSLREQEGLAVKDIEEVHRNSSENHKAIAQGVVQFFRTRANSGC